MSLRKGGCELISDTQTFPGLSESGPRRLPILKLVNHMPLYQIHLPNSTEIRHALCYKPPIDLHLPSLNSSILCPEHTE